MTSLLSTSPTKSTNTIMSQPSTGEKHDGTAFRDLFESVGKKAEHVSDNEARHATTDDSGNPPGAITSSAEDDDQKVVDEIESLCMNCHENVIFGCSRLHCGTC